jgi:septal ring factor EnvC (AmiA/AmiB activator)
VGDSSLDPSENPSGAKIPVLFGAVVALVGASLYQFYEVRQVRAELESTREALLDQISKVHETSTVSSKTNRESVDSLKTQMDAARRQASILAGQAKLDATKHADELADKLEKMQQEETAKMTEKVTAVSGDVSKVRDDANSTKTRVGEVSTDLAAVKTDAAATRAELEKTVANLSTTRGDLGVQSGLIATNSKELAALRSLGERNYTEFRLTKEKAPRKVGDIQIRLKSADMKKNRYTIEVIADDKLVEKKDKTINEPVQFMLSRATMPFEIVVNEVKKDMISGYVSAPKVQQARSN